MSTSQSALRMVDSMSDGMCGWVEWGDGTRRVRVRWSVSDPDGITSQHAANEEAKRRLRLYEECREWIAHPEGW